MSVGAQYREPAGAPGVVIRNSGIGYVAQRSPVALPALIGRVDVIASSGAAAQHGVLRFAREPAFIT